MHELFVLTAALLLPSTPYCALEPDECPVDDACLAPLSSPPGLGPEMRFGASTASSGATLVVGAPGVPGKAFEGAVYVYDFGVGGWSWVQTLTPSQANGVLGLGQSFGIDLVLEDDVLIVGARNFGDTEANEGAAYVFERGPGGFVENAFLRQPSPQPGDAFGIHLALSGDRALIAAHGRDSFGVSNGGEVYVCERGATTWTLDPTGLSAALAPAVTLIQDDFFGVDLALDGEQSLIGALRRDGASQDEGAVFAFDHSGASPGYVCTISPPSLTPGAEFGVAIDMDGDRALIGAHRQDTTSDQGGIAFVVERDASTGCWLEVAQLLACGLEPADAFGASLALRGSHALVGAPSTDVAGPGSQSGAAYHFYLDSGGAWQEHGRIAPADGAATDVFGDALSVHLDGNRAVVGARLAQVGGSVEAGKAYTCVLSGPSLSSCEGLISLASGGVQAFDVSVGAQPVLNLYLLLGTLSGTLPGLVVDGHQLPLEPDAYFLFTLANPNRAVLSNSFGTLTPAGTNPAPISLNLPPGLPASFAGLTLHHACVVLDLTSLPGSISVGTITNAVPVVLVP